MLLELEFEREHRVKMITSICYILQLAIYDLLLLKIKELALTSLEIIFRKCMLYILYHGHRSGNNDPTRKSHLIGSQH